MARKSKRQQLVDTAVLAPLDWIDERTAAVTGTKWFLFRHVPHDISLDALVLIPEPLSRARSVAAFAHDEAAVHVMLLDLADLEALQPLEAAAHFGAAEA